MSFSLARSVAISNFRSREPRDDPMKTLSIQLDDKLERDLARPAEVTGRTDFSRSNEQFKRKTHD
jgi:hypothetical protein